MNLNHKKSSLNVVQMYFSKDKKEWQANTWLWSNCCRSDGVHQFRDFVLNLNHDNNNVDDNKSFNTNAGRGA